MLLNFKMDGTFVPAPRLLPKLRAAVSDVKSWWFDAFHGVKTRATEADKRGAHGDHNLGFWYLPTWPGTARAALQSLPIANLSAYTFVDFGSGKGRILLLAATLPFRRVVGIELDRKLHAQAEENLRNYRNLTVACGEIKSINMDALQFEFPNELLVLYLFNPFGEEIMKQFVQRLENSLERCPRDVFLIFVHPEYAYVAGRSKYFQLFDETQSCHRYRSIR